ncbi:MAG: hypothetical protein NTX23_05400 [Candidatus Bipolaricaulota bacterium]|nr:hypothetical protein [Candidatus Bipolaricaulota bacterium]
MKRSLAAGLILALCVAVASSAQTLSGSWNTTVGITPSPAVLSLDSELIVTYAVSGWSFTSDTLMDETGWADQRFDVSGTLGAVALGSSIDFTPTNPSAFFGRWTATASASLSGVTYGGTFTLTPGNARLVITTSGVLGSATLGSSMTFGDLTPVGVCDLNWRGVTATIGFPFCCADVTGAMTFDCAGFNKATLKVEDIAIPGLAWVTLDALLTFQVQTKSLVLTPSFDFGLEPCFSLYLGVGSLILNDITIDGIGLSCNVGGVAFTGQSYWGTGTKPSLLSGTSYWEAYQIATTGEGCCGPFDFDVTAYFLAGGLQLFDVSKIVANMSIQIATQFTFSTGISIDLAAAPNAFTQWTLGFLVEW